MPIRRKLPQVRGNRFRPRLRSEARGHPVARQFPIRLRSSGHEYLVLLPLVGRKRCCRGVVGEGVEDVGRHEAHFGQVTNLFFHYVTSPQSLPAWETPYMLAKYTVSTKGVRSEERRVGQE